MRSLSILAGFVKSISQNRRFFSCVEDGILPTPHETPQENDLHSLQKEGIVEVVRDLLELMERDPVFKLELLSMLHRFKQVKREPGITTSENT